MKDCPSGMGLRISGTALIIILGKESTRVGRWSRRINKFCRLYFRRTLCLSDTRVARMHQPKRLPSLIVGLVNVLGPFEFGDFATAQQPASSQRWTLRAPVTDAFLRLPSRQVKPLGWIKVQLEENSNGFTGHPKELTMKLIVEDDRCGCDRLSPYLQSKKADVEIVIEADQARFLGGTDI